MSGTALLETVALIIGIEAGLIALVAIGVRKQIRKMYPTAKKPTNRKKQA